MQAIMMLYDSPDGPALVNELRVYAVEREIRLLGYRQPKVGGMSYTVLEEVFQRRLPDGRTIQEAAEESAKGKIADVDFIEAFAEAWRKVQLT